MSWSTGTMWRGIEVILKGRDPRDAWAFTERICGVCTGIHALAAVRAVEGAIGIKIPANANIIRNLMNAVLFVQDHVTHFYQLHALDWVDVISALNADPREAAAIEAKISPTHELNGAGYFADIQRQLKASVAGGQLSIFKNGYWGHPGYKFPPEANLMLVAHYIEALDFQKDVVQIHTVFGGKNPHPNWLVAQPFQKAVLHQDFQDVLQIFFRDILPRGDLLQRDIAFGLMLGQVDHHTQRIAAFG